MPIYEYRCGGCGKRTSVFVRSVASAAKPACEHCGSTRLSRLMSKFAVHRGGGGFDDASLDSFDESDPRAMARMARQMAEESGEPMDAEFEEMVSRMEAGEIPGDMDGDGGDFGDDEF